MRMYGGLRPRVCGHVIMAYYTLKQHNCVTTAYGDMVIDLFAPPRT